MNEDVSRVVIGMDPRKRSVTIEVMTADESVVGGGRFETTVGGYAAMLEHVAAWPERVWAVEGCEGIGRHIAHRILADGEEVVDVPAKLSARARVFATGQGRIGCSWAGAARSATSSPARSASCTGSSWNCCLVA